MSTHPQIEIHPDAEKEILTRMAVYMPLRSDGPASDYRASMQALKRVCADLMVEAFKAKRDLQAAGREQGRAAKTVEIAEAIMRETGGDVIADLQAQLRTSEEALTIAARRIVRLEQGLVDVIAHHVRLNQQQGRPTSHSRTIKIAQGALKGDPAEHLGMRVTGITVQPEGEQPRAIGGGVGVLVPGVVVAEGTIDLQMAEPVAWVCPTAGCGHNMTHAEHLVARLDNPCPGCHQALSTYQPVPF